MQWFLLHPEVWLLLKLVLGVLVGAGVVIVAIRPLRIKDYDNIVTRYWAWWVMAVVFAGGVLIHRAISFALMTGLSLWAMREYNRLVPELRANRMLASVCYGSVVALMLTAFINWYGLFQTMPIYCVLAALLVVVLQGKPAGMTDRGGEAVLGIIYFGWMFSHLLYMLNYPAGQEMALYLVLLTELNDVVAYTSGRIFGRHKLAPTISPNKTVEGFVGGAVVTVGLALLLGRIIHLPWVHALALGLIVGLFGVVGDLVISVFKRDRQVKDTGHGIPGHGGLLDRVDSLLFVTPIFFHYARFFDLFGFVASCLAQ